MASNNLVCVAKIVAAHGIRGQCKVKSLLANPNDILQYPALQSQSGVLLQLSNIKHQKDDIFFANIENINSRTEAEKLKGTELFLDKNVLPPLPEDEIYYDDLIGFKVMDEKNYPLGTVSAVYDFGAGTFLEIACGKKTVSALWQDCQLHEEKIVVLRERLV